MISGFKTAGLNTGDVMTLLILGSILFLASQMISAFGLRARVEAIGGHHAYMGLVTVLSVISFDTDCYGISANKLSAGGMPLSASYALASYLMPIATILIVAGIFPTISGDTSGILC